MHARLLASILALAAPIGGAVAGPECRCLYDGRVFEQGETVCIRIGAQTRLARCGMLLNNSSWTFLKDGCPTAMMTPLPAAMVARLAQN